MNKPTTEATTPAQAKIYILSKGKKIEILQDSTLEINGNPISTVKKNGDVEIQMSMVEIQEKALSEARSYYQERIKKYPSQNLIILAGSGSSYGIGKASGPKGQTMAGLWDELAKKK